MRRALLLADLVGLSVAFAAVELLVGSEGHADRFGLLEEAGIFLLWLPVWALGAKLFGLYDRDEERADHSTSDDLVRVFLLMTVSMFLLSRASTLTGGLNPEDSKLTILWLLSIASVTGARVAGRALARRKVDYLQNTVIAGAGDVGQLLARKLLQHPEYGLNLVGFVDADPRPRREHLEHVAVLGGFEDLHQVVDTFDVERVVFAFSSDPHVDYLHVIRDLREAGVQVDVVPRLFEVIGPKIDIHTLEGVSLVGLPPVRPSRSTRMLKRALDVVGASAALLATAPLFILAALLIKRDSPGPVFFRQPRLGQGMREFNFLKFRTMAVDSDDGLHREYIKSLMSKDAAPGENGLYKLDRADAVTRVGGWLRRTSLDELPQLINVLRGDMSLVGPRPCLAYEVEHFAPHHFDRFLVPAGMTGLWQVSARAHSTFVEALDLDVLYAQSAGLGLDLRLLARTPLQLIRSSGTA